MNTNARIKVKTCMNETLSVKHSMLFGMRKKPISSNNRIAQYYAKRPQVQERLTNQIAHELIKVLRTDDVAVIIDSKHLCVSSRGVEDHSSSTVTTYYGGKFKYPEKISELQSYIHHGL